MTLGKDIRTSFDNRNGRKRAFSPPPDDRSADRVFGVVGERPCRGFRLAGGGRPDHRPLGQCRGDRQCRGAAATALGGAFGGYWLDEATGQLTVGVTDGRQADTARDIGAVPREVSRSASLLDAVQARLDARARADTAPASVASWGVDLPTNSLVVQVLDTDQAGLDFATAGGDAVRI